MSECTGVTATYCPVHGDCTCGPGADGTPTLDDGGCPLHGMSEHGIPRDDPYWLPRWDGMGTADRLAFAVDQWNAAGDEVERLRAEVERLRATISAIADDASYPPTDAEAMAQRHAAEWDEGWRTPC